MKKTFIYSVMMLMVALMMGSCAESKLRIAVAAINRELPKRLNEQMTMKSVELEDNYLTLLFTVNDDAVIDQFNENPQVMKVIARTMLLGIKEKSEEGLKLFTEANVGVKTVMLSESGDKQATGEFTPEEIAELLSKEELPADNVLVLFVETINKMLPEDLGNGVTQAEAKLQEKALVYKYEVDENVLKMSDVEKEQAQMKESIKNIIRTNPRSLGGEQVLGLVASSDRSLAFEYVGKESGKIVKIELSSVELNSLLK